ncbi:MAG TPA: kinase [Candidatus Ozemobacteraceae bacterium]|nr:kinase [Candidatus Ozemobacteraceae bacterium]
MIISRTPFRISFFGGGTDYPSWYRRFGGAVLATAIDKYCYITCRHLPPFFEHRLRVVYSRIENCQSIDEISHPAVREVLKLLDFQRGIEIHHDGDLPARSGMGTSSAFTVGMLHAVHALKGEMCSKQQLATEGIDVEQNRLNETVGSQDQITAAHGGFNHITFHKNGSFSVNPVILPAERYEAFNSHLLLFYTGIKRTSGTIAESYATDLEARRPYLSALQDMVAHGQELLTGKDDLEPFGRLLNEAWQIKRSLSSQVSNQAVDDLYAAGLEAGALGGKLLGAGGGGFLLLFASPARHEAIRQRLHHLIHVPIRFDFSGSQIIFFDREKDYLSEEDRRRFQPVAAFREHSE